MRAWDFTHQVIEAEDWTAVHHMTWRNGEWYGLTEHPNTSEDGSSTFGVPTRWWFFRDVLGLGGPSVYSMADGFGPRPPWWRRIGSPDR
jgi:hypothetical protein